MAASDLIERRGLAEAIQAIGALKGEVARAARGSVGTTATATRRRLVVLAMAETGLRRALLNSRTPIRRSNRPGDYRAQIRPSQKGIPVPDYRWTHQPTGHPTRHRILIDWPGGKKVAAGFVNPFGQYQAPLTTRLKGHDLAVALGPSAAALLSILFSDSDLGKAAQALQTDFLKRLETAVDRRSE